MEVDTLYPQTCINQGEKWRWKVTECSRILPSSLQRYNDCLWRRSRDRNSTNQRSSPWLTVGQYEMPQSVHSIDGESCITVWVTEYTDGWACVVTYLCVHSESKVLHSSGWDLDPPYLWILILNDISIGSANKNDRQTDSKTDRPRYLFCSNRPHSHALRATRQKNVIILQQLRFVKALSVNLSCQSTADTSADVCGEEMSSDFCLFRFGRAAATYRQVSVHQRDVGFDELLNIPKLLMQNLIAVFHKK